ncbi:MAG: glycine cleavage system protein GcvH [Actinomycetota bacterium]|nr:glycine cleavage system protein GcvH [Actinomycetota bacterium]
MPVQIPEDLRYTENHEWVRLEGDGAVVVGISEYAQDALGDIVYVDLPDIGRSVKAGESIAEVESTKSVNDVYAPISGVVATVNEPLMDAPELVNTDPFGAGWFVTLTPAEGETLETLMDAVAYATFTEE